MNTQHDALMADPGFRKLLAEEALVAEASELIARLMAEQKLSKADLARRLNKSRAWVTQLLSGASNMTIRTLAEVVHLLDAEIVLQSRPARWKNGEKPKTTGGSPVVFRMDNYIVSPAAPSAEMFRLEDQQLTCAEEEIAPLGPVQARPDYAA